MTKGRSLKQSLGMLCGVIAAAYAVLFFFMLLTYPLTSTAPSDAQDVIAMWFYLASVVLLANMLSAKHAETEEV